MTVSSIDGRVGDGNNFLVAVKQRSAADRRSAARGQNVAEDHRTDQIFGRRARTAGEADGLDRGILRNDAAPSAHERLYPDGHIRCRGGASCGCIWDKHSCHLERAKLGRYADIAAAEVMQQSVIREMRPPAAGADLAHVEVMAVAFGAEADPVEKALFEIIASREDAQVSSDVIAEPLAYV